MIGFINGSYSDKPVYTHDAYHFWFKLNLWSKLKLGRVNVCFSHIFISKALKIWLLKTKKAHQGYIVRKFYIHAQCKHILNRDNKVPYFESFAHLVHPIRQQALPNQSPRALPNSTVSEKMSKLYTALRTGTVLALS